MQAMDCYPVFLYFLYNTDNGAACHSPAVFSINFQSAIINNYRGTVTLLEAKLILHSLKKTRLYYHQKISFQLAFNLFL